MPLSKNDALRKAVQLCTIASDWNLDEVEIDGKMVCIYELKDELQEALEHEPVQTRSEG